MKTRRKITLMLPEELIRKAQKQTRKNLTATIRQALQILAMGEAYETLLKWKGKVKLDIDLAELRKDRDK